MHGPDAVNIRRDIGDREVAGVHHPQIDVQGFPEFFHARGARRVTLLARVEGPLFAHVDGIHIFQSILVQAADCGLEPRIKNNPAEGAQEIADPIPPTEFLLLRPRGHKVHRPREVNACAAEEVVLLHAAEDGPWTSRLGSAKLRDLLRVRPLEPAQARP